MFYGNFNSVCTYTQISMYLEPLPVPAPAFFPLSNDVEDALFNLCCYTAGDRLFYLDARGAPEFLTVVATDREEGVCMVVTSGRYVAAMDDVYAYYDALWDDKGDSLFTISHRSMCDFMFYDDRPVCVVR